MSILSKLIQSLRTARTTAGAGAAGMIRLLDLYALSCAADTAIIIGLAGTIFFDARPDQARGRVALYLLLTMVPFALLAPLIGAALARIRSGQRYILAATMLGRIAAAWLIAMSLPGFGVYPAALAALGLSRAFGIARASAVPGQLPATLSLPQARSRASLYAAVAVAVTVPIALVLYQISPSAPIWLAAVLFAGAMISSIRLPGRPAADPAWPGGAATDPASPESAAQAAQVRPWVRYDTTGARILSGPVVVAAVTAGVLSRAGYGFLAIFSAFGIRTGELAAEGLGLRFSHPMAVAVIAGAFWVGTIVATSIGSAVRPNAPVRLNIVALSMPAVVAVVAALAPTIGWLALLGLVTAVASGLSKVAIEAVIQQNSGSAVRAAAFAQSEMLLLLAWIAGAALGLLPLDGRLGIWVVAAAMLAAAVWASAGRLLLRRRMARAAATAPPTPAASPVSAAASAAPTGPVNLPSQPGASGAQYPASAGPVVPEQPLHIYRPSQQPYDFGATGPTEPQPPTAP